MKVLQVVSSLDGSGGVQRLLLSYYRHMNYEKIKFDFIVYGDEIGELETEFEAMGSQIFHVVNKHKGLLKSLQQMNQVIKSGGYDIIHVHQDIMSVFPIFLAKRMKIKKRIAHSHLAFRKRNFLKKIQDQVLIFFLKRWATDWWACSNDAGEALWGKAAVQKKKVYIMKNAIDIEAFSFNKEIREDVRKTLEIENQLVIGSVGRFTYQKNHEMLIEIFNEIYKENANTILLLVGKGELEENVRKQVSSYGLEKAVKFLGVRSDINELLQAMDAFVLPSRYEGLGIVYIEAQAAGLPCFGTKEALPEEVKVTDLMHFISKEEGIKYWADEVIKYAQTSERENTLKEISEAGYSIQEEAMKLELKYGGV